MPKLTHDALQTWYAQLKQSLYEQVNVDLDRKEDLGHIRIMRINDMHHEDPDAIADVDMIYPFIPHRPLNSDEPSADPLLSYYCYDPPAPSKADTEAYHQWLFNSLTTPPSDDLIQELYDMSSEGQLMVIDGFSEPETHQIYTQNGQITISDKYSKIKFEQNPDPVAPPQDDGPALPNKPAEQPEPGDPPKGFWIRVGNFFGIRTRYTDYVERKDAYDKYLKDLDNWEKIRNERITEWERKQQNPVTYQERIESLKQQTEAFNQYIQEFTNYFMNPLNRFEVAFRFNMEKLRKHDDENETLWNQRVAEDGYWSDLHQNTLLGKMQTGKDDATRTYKELHEMQEAVEAAFGPKYKTGILNFNGIIASHKNVPSYAAPVMNGAKLSDRNAAWICLAFLSDPTVLEENPEGAQLDDLGGQERYQKIMDALLLNGEQNSDPLFAFIQGARAAGAEAMRDYALGKPERLAITIGNCIRRQNELTSYQTDPYSLKSYAITSALLEVLDANPDLMKNCKLTPEELQQARTNATTYQANLIGLPAKAELLGHALHQNTLNQNELQSAAADLLLMNTVNAQAEKKQDIHLKPEEIQQTRQALTKHAAVDQIIKLDRAELGKAAALSQEQLAQLPQVNPEMPKAPQNKPLEPQAQISQPQAVNIPQV